MRKLLVSLLLLSWGLFERLHGANTVSVHFDPDSPAMAFAAERIVDALGGRALSVASADLRRVNRNASRERIALTLSKEPTASRLLGRSRDGVPVSIGEQGYSLRVEKKPGWTNYWIIGGDATGAMYGGLDVADLLDGGASLSSIRNVDKKPFIRSRGLKFNIPLDARTPSYSDNNRIAQANIPHMWDMDFWKEFLDEMALNRLNRLTLWSLSPFPSMTRIPEYPRVGLDDVKRTTLAVDAFGRASSGTENVTPELLENLETVKSISLDEKIAFWKAVMRYADDRGVGVFIYTWNLFTFGTEGAGYDLVPDIRNEATRDYLRRATRALLETYPLLKGMGVTAGENMSHDDIADETFLFETYGRGINDALETDPQRSFQLSHRLGDISAAKRAFRGLNPRCSLSFTYKYSKAHVYTSVDPYWIHDHKFIEEIGERTPYYITIRDDSYNYLRGGSDPEFVRQYLYNIPNTDSNFQGFQLGPDATVWGREHVSRDPDNPRQLMLKKRWYSLRIWGHLSYDPNLPDMRFRRLLAARFPDVDSERLFEAWAVASRIVPLVNRFHNYKAYLDYQWNPELCHSRPGYNSDSGFHDMETFIRVKPQRGEGFVGIGDFANGNADGISPYQVGNELRRLGERTLATLPQAAGEELTDKELRQTLSDIRTLGYLGIYYGHKVTASTDYAFFKKTGEESHRRAALASLRKASNAWWRYSHRLTARYKPMYYSRLRKQIDLLHIQDYVDKEIVELGGQVPERPLNDPYSQ